MNIRRITCIVALALAFMGLPTARSTAGAAELNQDLCVLCHDQAPRDIGEAGGRHQSAVGCLDCHEGHPPRQAEIIPTCSQCHSGEAHFTLEDCFSCHSNPHRPLEIKIGSQVTAPCLTCHEEPGRQLKEISTRHSVLSCSSCHQEKHGAVPECLLCHQAHEPSMTNADCTTCHQAHQPAPVQVRAEMPSVACSACHDEIVQTLSAGKSKHAGLTCGSCHQGDHRTVPACSQCHEQPHWKGLADKFPNCLDCHVDPHDLPI